jgi:hypothetical protein
MTILAFRDDGTIGPDIAWLRAAMFHNAVKPAARD